MFQLTIEDGDGRTTDRITFEHGSYIIGRQDGCDILLPSGSVSRRHARIFVNRGRCYIEDLGSANGITVDGQRVVKQRDLGTASLIEIGDYYIYVEYKRPNRPSRPKNMQTLFIAEGSDHCKIVRINDAFAGEEFSLSEVENSIGRTDENFILLSDPSISRHHAQIIREGDSYTLDDCGSSNGSRLNGKLVKGPVALQPGDRIHFGNVEFVFVEGAAQINPAEFARNAGGPLLSRRALVPIVLAAVTGGALLVFGALSMESEPAPAQPAAAASSSPAAAALARGEEQLAARQWEAAEGTFAEALRLEPGHPGAQQLQARAKKERAAQQSFERGEVLVEQGKLDEARRVLKEVPEQSAVYARAQGTLEHVDKTEAYNLKNQALRLSKRDQASALKEAHDKLKRSLSLSPDDAEARKLLQEVERKLTKKKIAFETFASE